MFSDFRTHNIGVPQIAPAFGAGRGNVIFDGPGENEDFGLEQVTGNPVDRYKFRSSPLRNVALLPAFFHNGAYTRLEDAIGHHLDVPESVQHYNPAVAGVARDLSYTLRSMESVLETLDLLLAEPIHLDDRDFDDLVAFVRYGLLDDRAPPASLCRMIPKSVPSGRPMLFFENCQVSAPSMTEQDESAGYVPLARGRTAAIAIARISSNPGATTTRFHFSFFVGQITRLRPWFSRSVLGLRRLSR